MEFENEQELQDFMEEKLGWSPSVTRSKRIYDGELVVGNLTINYGPSIERLIDIKIEALKKDDVEKARICQEIYEKYCYGVSKKSIAYTAEQEEEVISLTENEYESLERRLQTRDNSSANEALLKECKDFLAMVEGTNIENEFDLYKLKKSIAKLEKTSENQTREENRIDDEKNQTEQPSKNDQGKGNELDDFYNDVYDGKRINEPKKVEKTITTKEEKNKEKEPKAFVRHPMVAQLVTAEKYGEFAPIVQEYLNRTLNEFDLSSEFLDLFVNSCDTIKVGKMPKGYENAGGVTIYPTKKIIINKDYLSGKKNSRMEKYQTLAHILSHEVQHFVMHPMRGVGTGLLESIIEVAASRISFGKDKKNMKNYKAETLGYPNLTFGANILAAAMGKSEKEFLKLAYGNKLYETVVKQMKSKKLADEFLFGINQELETIKRVTYDERHTKEELKAIQTRAYHALYIYGKDYLNKRIAVLDIDDNINEITESLKFSSNKLTQILEAELHNWGDRKLKPAFKYKNGFSFIVRSPKETQNIQKDQRNTLNAKIAILDRLSKEFKENPIFQGENGEKRQKRILLYVQKFAFSTKDIVYMNNIFKEKLNLDLSDTFAEFINSSHEKQFELKPETIRKIEQEDFNTSYDRNAVELMKQALNPPLKTRLKYTFLKMKGKIFKRKPQLYLPSTLDSDGRVRPKLYADEEPIQAGIKHKNSREVQQSWTLTQSDREAIQKANVTFAKKYEKEQNYMTNDNRDGTDYEGH